MQKEDTTEGIPYLFEHLVFQRLKQIMLSKFNSTIAVAAKARKVGYPSKESYCFFLKKPKSLTNLFHIDDKYICSHIGTNFVYNDSKNYVFYIAYCRVQNIKFQSA